MFTEGLILHELGRITETEKASSTYACKRKGYFGFAGFPWPYEGKFKEAGLHVSEFSELAPFDQLDLILDVQKTLPANEDYRLVYLLYGKETSSTVETDEFISRMKFAGYDYGNYICTGNYWSVIYSEILFGTTKLCMFRECLNVNLLFPNTDHIAEVEQIRKSLVEEGVDLETIETDEPLLPIKIWRPVDISF